MAIGVTDLSAPFIIQPTMNHISDNSFVYILIVSAILMFICFILAMYYASKLEREKMAAGILRNEQPEYGTKEESSSSKKPEKPKSEKKEKDKKDTGKAAEAFRKGTTLLEMSKRWKGKSSKIIANST